MGNVTTAYLDLISLIMLSEFMPNLAREKHASLIIYQRIRPRKSSCVPFSQAGFLEHKIKKIQNQVTHTHIWWKRKTFVADCVYPIFAHDPIEVVENQLFCSFQSYVASAFDRSVREKTRRTCVFWRYIANVYCCHGKTDIYKKGDCFLI